MNKEAVKGTVGAVSLSLAVVGALFILPFLRQESAQYITAAISMGLWGIGLIHLPKYVKDPSILSKSPKT